MFVSPGSRARPGLLRLISRLQTSGNLLISQGTGQGNRWPAAKAVSGDATLAATGALTVTKTSGVTLNLRGFDTVVNLQLNATVSANILTIAVKTANTGGADPTTTNPVIIPFRDVTIANGDPILMSVTSALSVDTNAVGATLGTVNSVPFRLWVVAFANGGIVSLALWQSVTGGSSPTAVAALNEAAVQNSTGFSGSATSAGVFYTQNGTALSGKAFRILGYVDYASGLATAGTYASAPTTVQLFGPGIKKPGDVLQMTFATDSTAAAASSATKVQTTTSLSITPTAAMNPIRVHASGVLSSETNSVGAFAQLSRGTGPTLIGALAATSQTIGAGIIDSSTSLLAFDTPKTTTATTYVVFLWGAGAGAFDWNRAGAFTAAIEAQEIMA